MKANKDRRGRAVRWIALALVALMVLGVVVSAIFSAALAEERGQCEMELTMLEDYGAVSVSQTVTYPNQTGQHLDQILFQLASNALRRETTAPYESGTMIDAYPDGFAAGGVELHSVLFNGAPADWGAQGTDEATLRVSCDLAPGESGTFQFDYELILPDVKGPIGTGDIGWRLSGFSPLPATWKDEFVVERVSPVGESLLADPMETHVTVNLPDTWQVAAGGSMTSVPSGDARQTVTIDLPSARVCALALSRKYIEADGTAASGVTVRAFANDHAAASRAANIAVQVLNVYEPIFGAYPYGSLAVAEGDLLDGLAQSGIEMIPEEYYSYAQRDELTYQVALLTARQWFGGVVGSNPAEEPWLTESLSAYAALLYYDKVYGYDRYLQELNTRVTPSLRLTIPGGVTVDSEALTFGTVSDYLAVTRGRGAAVMHELRMALGEDVLHDALKRYVSENTGRIATGRDFLSALNEAAGRVTEGLLVELLTGIDEYVGHDVDWYE